MKKTSDPFWPRHTPTKFQVNRSSHNETCSRCGPRTTDKWLWQELTRANNDTLGYETFLCVYLMRLHHMYYTCLFHWLFEGTKVKARWESRTCTFLILEVFSNPKPMYSHLVYLLCNVDSYHSRLVHTWAHGPWTISFNKLFGYRCQICQ